MSDYDILYNEHQDLQENFITVDAELQKALLELEKFKESSSYGATFTFEDGNQIFIPVFGIPTGLKANGQSPVKYALNFDETTVVEWIYQADMALKKNQK